MFRENAGSTVKGTAMEQDATNSSSSSAVVGTKAAAAQKQEERSNVEIENQPKRSQVSQQGSISEKIQKAYRK